MYPILHSLQEEGLIKSEEKVVEGKVRKYYSITPKGEGVLEEAKNGAYELFKEIKE